MSKEPKRNVYVGHRYVPLIMDEWDKSISYEGLSIVTYKGGSYTSKKHVPIGIDITNEEYWAMTGNYNAQVEHYRKEVKTLKSNVEENKEKLDKLSSKLSNFSKLVSENDDTERLKRAIHHAELNGNVLMIDENVNVSERIVFNSIKVLGINNPLFTINSADDIGIELKGENVKLKNLEINGSKDIRTVISVSINSKNVEIENNYIHGGFSNVFGSYGIDVNDGCVDVYIHHNKIEDIHSTEDGIIGNSLGSARGILLRGVKNALIQYNEFNDIGGFEDGDCIQTQTKMKDSSFIIEYNIFNNITKRGVKLQAPNNIVRFNKFYSDYDGEGNDTTASAIADYDANNEIYENEIVLKRSYTGIDISGSVNCKVYKNYIENNKNGFYTSARGSSTSVIIISEANKTNIYNNELVSGRLKLYATVPNKDVIIKDNILSEGSGTYVRIIDVDGLRLEDNIFKGSETVSPHDMVRFDNPSNLIIGGNEFNWGTNIVRFHGVIDNVLVYYNTIKNNQSNSRYRTAEVTSGIETFKVLNDYVTGQATIAEGETSVVVSHGLGRKPDFVGVTSTTDNAPNFHVTRGDSTLQIHLLSVQDRLTSFNWKAE